MQRDIRDAGTAQATGKRTRKNTLLKEINLNGMALS